MNADGECGCGGLQGVGEGTLGMLNLPRLWVKHGTLRHRRPAWVQVWFLGLGGRDVDVGGELELELGGVDGEVGGDLGGEEVAAGEGLDLCGEVLGAGELVGDLGVEDAGGGLGELVDVVEDFGGCIGVECFCGGEEGVAAVGVEPVVDCVTRTNIGGFVDGELDAGDAVHHDTLGGEVLKFEEVRVEGGNEFLFAEVAGL